MASFHFSPELLGIIASHSDITTLKTLRLTSHTLCFFATKYLFSEVSLYTEDESCQAFESILTHPQLSDKVYKVRLNTVEVDYVSEILLPHRRCRMHCYVLSAFSHCLTRSPLGL